MVKEIKKNKNTYYTCEECGFIYEEKEIAKKCEEWCKEYHSCNIEITSYAVQVN